MENNDLNLEFPDVNVYGETTSIKEPTEKEISHAFYSANRDNTFYSVGDLKHAGYTKLIRSKPKEDLEPGIINDNMHPYSHEGVVQLFRQKAIYQNVNTEELGLLIRYFYEYYDEYSHKYKYKLISKEMYDEARRQYAKRQSEKEKAAADKLIADFKPENFWTKKQKDSFIKQLEEYCANDYIDYNLVTQIEKEIDAELNSPGWCVVCKLTDNYAKSHPDSRSKIEKENLTKEEANDIADYYNEPIYRQLNVSNAWSYEPMEMSDANQFLAKRNAEEKNLSNKI